MKFIECSFLEFTFRNMSNLQCLFHEITFLLQFTSQYWSNSFHRTENVRQFVVLVVAFVTVETSSIAFFALSSAQNIFKRLQTYRLILVTSRVPLQKIAFIGQCTKKNSPCLTKSYLTCGRKRVMTGQIKYYNKRLLKLRFA